MEITFTSLPEKQTELSFSKCFFSAIPLKSFFPGRAGYPWDSRENSVVWPVYDMKRRTERPLVAIVVIEFFLVDQIESFMFAVDWHSFHLCWWVLSSSYRKGLTYLNCRNTRKLLSCLQNNRLVFCHLKKKKSDQYIKCFKRHFWKSTNLPWRHSHCWVATRGLYCLH